MGVATCFVPLSFVVVNKTNKLRFSVSLQSVRI